jgi:hypothetical protein
MLGLVIDGNRQPTMDDVDNWVERKGSIEQAFDGVLAAEGAGDELMVFKYSNAPFFYITKNVVFRLWTEGCYAWLVVVDRRIRDHSVCFRADPDRLQFRIHDCDDAVYDAVYDECLYMITESMVYWDAVNMPVLTPMAALQRSPGASEYPARTPMAASQRSPGASEYPLWTPMAALKRFTGMSELTDHEAVLSSFSLSMVFMLCMLSYQVLVVEQHATSAVFKLILVYFWVFVLSNMGYAAFVVHGELYKVILVMLVVICSVAAPLFASAFSMVLSMDWTVRCSAPRTGA